MAPMKLSQIAKDFNIKAKDVSDAFKDIGLEKKNSSATVDDEEFEIFFSHITRSHQIKDIDAYTSGRVKISAVDEKKAKSEKPAETKEEPKTKAQKAEPKKDEAPKAAPQQKAEPKKDEAPKAAPQQKAEPKKDEAPKAVPQQKAEPKKDEAPQKDAPKFEQKKFERPGEPKNQDQRQRFDAPQNQRQNSSTYYAPNQKQQYSKYNDRTSQTFDPFVKRRENMNRAAEGKRVAPGQQPFDKRQQQKPLQNAQPAVQKPAQSNAQPAVQKPQAQPSTVRPAQQAQAEKQQRLAKQLEAQKQQAASAPKKEEKRAQKQQFKTITPNIDMSNVKGGVNINSDYKAESPKTRVVDMRTSDVNLSKYDERYNDQFYAIANGTDTKAQKQKLKKQDNRGQNAKSAKDKERAAQEKIKKLEAERARNKQLEITVPDEITIGELASRLKKTSAEVIKKLMMMGEMKGVNDVVDYATAELIADDFGAKVTKEVVVTIEEKLFTEAEENIEDLEERAPVVCVMGHVDHGKTSILDAIRHTNVTKGEAGGITQAIGAYRVKANGKDITFLDTPGHEAFTAMRMRGAKSTDIAILVVAADDGVMPQTIEAINHAKAAGIDIIVAINKMDKPQANPDNVLNQLTQYELVPEAWGGDVICVPVSALTGMGIDNLLENVLLVAEVKELKANPNRRAKGLVIESKLDRGRGPVATVLVQNGTLHQGDYVIVGNAVGRVRVMVDDKGKAIKVAGPSVPVEIVGLDDVPQAGDELNAKKPCRAASREAETGDTCR